MLVVDEAYAEFAAGPDYETGIDLVESGHNVVVLRTFSKAYGLAGLRVGRRDGIAVARARADRRRRPGACRIGGWRPMTTHR